MEFATKIATFGELLTDFTDEFALNSDFKSVFTIRFAKTLLGHLELLTAKYHYNVDSSPVNPDLDMCCVQDVMGDVFGKAIPVSLFGRHFDGTPWFVERSFIQSRWGHVKNNDDKIKLITKVQRMKRIES